MQHDVAGGDGQPVAQRRQRAARRVDGHERGAGAHAAGRGLGDHAARRAAQRADAAALVDARAAGERGARAARTRAGRDGRSRPCARTRAPRTTGEPIRARAAGPSSATTSSPSTAAAPARVLRRRGRHEQLAAAAVPGVDALGLAPVADRPHACPPPRRSTPAPRPRRTARSATAATAPSRSRSRRCARSARARSAPPRARRRGRPDRPRARATPPTCPCSRRPRSRTSAAWSPSSGGQHLGLPASAIHQPWASWSKRATLHRRIRAERPRRPISSPLVPRLALLRLLLLPLRGD